MIFLIQTETYMIKKVCHHAKYLLIVSYINDNLIISTDFLRILIYKFRADPFGVLWVKKTDRRTDRDKESEKLCSKWSLIEIFRSCWQETNIHTVRSFGACLIKTGDNAQVFLSTE
jgi:hypothetical protein